MKIVSFILVLLCVVLGCKKENNKPDLPIYTWPGYNFPCEDTALDWSHPEVHDLAQFILYYGKFSVWRVLYDPFDVNVIYYLTTETTGSNRHLWRYNMALKAKTLIAQSVFLNMSMSKAGWIAFENGSNIFIIKSNGDSLRQVSFNVNGGNWPIWSEDGRYIYYSGINSLTSYKVNKLGALVDTFQNISVALSHKQFIYYVTYSQATQLKKLIRRDTITNEEKTILVRGGPNDKSGEDFHRVYLDKTGSNLYWSGDHGLSKTNLSTLKTIRLVNSGYNGSRTFIFQYSIYPKTGEIVAAYSHDSIPDPFHIYTKYGLIQFSSDGKCRRKVELPD